MSFIKLPNISLREYKQIAMPGIILWLLMAGLGIGSAASDTFFIGSSGAENIPRVLIFNAVILFTVSFFYSFLIRKISNFNFFILIIIFFLVVLLALRSQIKANYSWLPYALFCYYEVCLMIVQMHFWACLNDIFGPREAKRFFPIIGAFGLSGTIIGGFLVWLTVSEIGYHNLFYIWIFLLICTVPLILFMKDKDPKVKNIRSKAEKNSDSTLKGLLKIPLVRHVAIITVPLWLLVYTVDWLFYLSVEEIFIGRPDALSGFLGLIAGLTSLLGIILQVFVTSPLLHRYGVGVAYNIYPINMSFAALLFIIRPYLPTKLGLISNVRAIVPVAVSFLNESFFFSVYDSALQLLYGAIPVEFRKQARAFITGFVDNFVMLIAGGLLSILALNDISQQWIALGALALGGICIILNLNVHSHYLAALTENITSKDFDLRDQTLDQIKKTRVTQQMRRHLLKSVNNKNENVALLALRYIRMLGDHATLVQLGDNILKYDGAIFQVALHIIGDYKIEQTLPKLMRIYLFEEGERQGIALSCIGKIKPAFIQQNIEFLLTSSNESIKDVTIVSSLQSSKSFGVKNLAMHSLKKIVESNETEQQLKAIKILSQLDHKVFSDYLIELANKDEDIVRKEAIKVMGKYKYNNITSFLVREMSNGKNLNDINFSLIEQGDFCINALHRKISILKKEALKYYIEIKNIIFCLGEIGNKESAMIISYFIDGKNIHFENECMYALSKIVTKNKQALYRGNNKPNFSIKIDQLIYKRIDTYNNNLEEIGLYIQSLLCIESVEIKNILRDALSQCHQYYLNLLKKSIEVLHDPTTMNTAWNALKGDDPRKKSEAIEVLDDFGVFSYCYAIWGAEAIEIVEILEEEGKFFNKVLDNKNNKILNVIKEPAKLLESLFQIQDYPWLTSCVLYSIWKLKFKSLSAKVEEAYGSPYSLVRNSSLICLSKLGLIEKKSAQQQEFQKITMDLEKILFLRSVPMFSDVDVSELQWISGLMVEENFKTNTCIFNEKDKADRLYIVREGEVHIVKDNLKLQSLKAKEYFGEISVFGNKIRTATAITKKPTVLFSVDKKDFQRILSSLPIIALNLFRVVSDRLRMSTVSITAQT